MEKMLLIIDDSLENVEIVSEILADLFDQVLSANTVDEAQNKLKKNKFAFVVLDINLAGRNGAEVIKFLGDTPNNPNKNVPVLIISGIINSNFIERNQQRFAGILLKPFEHNDLRKIVENKMKDKAEIAEEEIPDLKCELPFPVVELQQRVNKVMEEVKKNAKLKLLFSQLKIDRTGENYILTHIGMLINISTAICIQMQWNTDKTLEKFIYASYLHDMALSSRPDLAKINSLDELESLKKTLSDSDYKFVLNHPRVAAKSIKNIPEIPPDVAMIVKQHHELPNGTGFPGRYSHSNITPLSTVFIVAHDLTEYILLNPKWTINDYINQAQIKFKGTHFSKVLMSLSDIK